jgi:ribonuclease III
MLPDFENPFLLQQALTHKSYRKNHPHINYDNERLEFLGDALLDFLSAEFFYQRFPDEPEGDLTMLRAALVSESQLAKFAVQLALGTQLRLGRGVESAGGRENPNILSSVFEAIVGAYYLDSHSQIEPIRAFVLPFFKAVATEPRPINFKSCLQEWALGTYGQLPQYFIVGRSGPDHAPEFIVQVSIVGEVQGQGQGRKKQDAEKAAAQAALSKLHLLGTCH